MYLSSAGACHSWGCDVHAACIHHVQMHVWSSIPHVLACSYNLWSCMRACIFPLLPDKAETQENQAENEIKQDTELTTSQLLYIHVCMSVLYASIVPPCMYYIPLGIWPTTMAYINKQWGTNILVVNVHQTGCLQLPRIIIRSRRESTYKLYYGLVAEPKAIHVVSLRCVPNEKQFPITSNSPSETWQVWLCRRRGWPPTVGCRKDMVRLNSGSSQLSTQTR